MSEDDATQTEANSESPQRDASFKIDASSLASDEADFARMMGFGDDGNEGASDEAQTAAAPTPASPAAAPAVEPDPEPEAHPPETPEAGFEPEDEVPMRVEDDDDARSSDWEEIHPRPVSEGMQTTLDSRADELLSRPGSMPFANDGVTAEAPAADPEAIARLRVQLAERDAELAALRAATPKADPSDSRLEKERDELDAEIETLRLDRDQLVDQLTVLSGELVQARSHNESLEASLRAARGALTPLPEGERALRAEVIGLRGRLDETRVENQDLANQLSSSATELAIARARIEDRQHEIDVHVERSLEIEAQLAQNQNELEDTVARHREMLAMTTRLQADNNELRSAQSALQETLEARGLEIAAREEHLAVTREGLTARDLQLVDLNERVDQERHRCESLAAELERARIDHDQLLAKLSHRESRIATLTQTLARIEEAMGHPLPAIDSTAMAMPQAEWSPPRQASRVAKAHQDRPNPSAPVVESNPTEEPEESSEPLPAASSACGDGTSHAGTGPTLPAVLGHWRDLRFGELLADEGFPSVHRFFADQLQRHLEEPSPKPLRLMSLGGGLADAEVRLVQAMQELGMTDVRVEVVDTDPIQADARRRSVERARLGDAIEVHVGEPAEWDAEVSCHAVLLADALSARPDASRILDHIAPSVDRGALVLFVDRIASGPLQLSASALNRLEQLWALLPESLTSAPGLSSVPHRGDDGGCSGPQSDGPYQLIERFEPIVVAGFGHLADLMVGSARGPAMSIESDEAMRLLESVMAMDESGCLAEDLAPRHGLAVLAHRACEPTVALGRTWPRPPDTGASEA